MKCSRFIFAVVLGALLTSWAFADESLGEKKKWKEQDEYMKEHVNGVKEKCGIDVPYTFDKSSFAKMDNTSYSPNGVCQNVYNNLYSLCGDEDGKKAVAKKVKKIVCKYSPKRSLAMSGSTLTWSGNNEEANVDDFMKEWFMKNF